MGVARRVPLIAIAVTIAAGVAGSAQAALEKTSVNRAPTLGIELRPGKIARLAWFEPVSMRSRPGRKVPLADFTGAWSFSADRSLLAIGHAGLPKLRLIDVRAMRIRGDMELTELTDFSGDVRAISWPAPRRVLALIESG